MHKTTTVKRFTTIIFDMDGLLLSTEPLWSKSMEKISTKYNVPIKPFQFKETTGLKINEVVQYWSQKYPWTTNISVTAMANEIIDEIIQLSKQEAAIMPGALSLLQTLKHKGIKIGLATSSPNRMMHELIDHFKLNSYFDILQSAEHEPYGKPHPAVFLQCAQALQSNSHDCLVLEDSINGMIAALAARMQVVVVPDASNYDHTAWAVAQDKWRSIEEGLAQKKLIFENGFCSLV